MKTLILATVSAVALLAAGAASAQAVPQVTVQSSAKSSQVYQYGNADAVSVNQSNAQTGYSYIKQGIPSDDTVYGSNYAVENNATLIQSNNASNAHSVIMQGGAKNGANVTQYGAGQESGVRQRGTTNYASTTQNGTGDGSHAVTPVEGNRDSTEVSGYFNTYEKATDGAFVDQIGTSNGSTINTDGASDLAVVYQNGSGNNALTTQNSGSYLDNSRILQVGTTNNASVNQSGAYNVSTVNQGTPDPKSKLTSASNIANVTQNGSFNGSLVNQFYNGNNALVAQYGYNGASEVNQNGGSTNADPGAGAGPGSVGSNNANVYQDGASRNAYSLIDQRSTGNYAEVKQYGSDDVSLINQNSGATNTALVLQAASKSYSTIYQSGGAQFATVKQ